MKRYAGLAILITLLTPWLFAQENLPANPAAQLPGADLPPTDARHHSYAIGLDIGTSFRTDQIQLDVESLVQGVRDALAGQPPKYTPAVCEAAMQRLSEQRLEIFQQRNRDFLVANRDAAGIQVTPTGLQYLVLKAGDGPSPRPTDRVRVHYRGQLIDGQVFDQSLGGPPAEFPVNRVIPGWTEALQQMRVGAHWRLFVPAELAYGEEGFAEAIPPHATLIFEVQLLQILP
jgi:FKBP-type peptidyl-prolyl cis-trans isomerase FklB